MISAHERPSRRSDAILEASTATLGRPTCFAFSLGRRQTAANSVADQFAFKFGNAGEDAEHEPTIRSARINALMDRDKINP